MIPGNALARKIAFRLAAGPSDPAESGPAAMAERERPDVVWADKLLGMKPETLEAAGDGIATVSYMIDNPFGTRQDPGWRLYMKRHSVLRSARGAAGQEHCGLQGAGRAGRDQDPDGV
jgi:hypothetical protein